MPRSWSELPSDLLSRIADTLGLIDLLSFRAVCKDWRSAAMTATAEVESAPREEPCVLLPTNYEECTFWDMKADKTYSIDIPELKEAIFLASKQGWLLLYKNGCLFFFCPFSRARIDLPEFPHSNMSDHIGTFSDPPTSPNCIVSILGPLGRLYKPNLELNVLSRVGGDTWTKCVHYPGTSVYSGTGFVTIVYSALSTDQDLWSPPGRDGKNGNSFYYEDGKGRGYRFLVGKKTWDSYSILYCDCKLYRNQSVMRKWLKVDDDLPIIGSGAILTMSNGDHVIWNKLLLRSGGSQGITLKGVWIQPRFYVISSDQTWFI